MTDPAHPISLAHLTVLDTTPPELIEVAAAAGFRTVGIRLTASPSVGVPPYDCLHEGPVLRDTLARLASTGISVLDTEFLRFEPDQPVGVPEGFLEVSARLGARHVLVMSAEPDEARTLERFGVRSAGRPGIRGLHGRAHARPRGRDDRALEAHERVHPDRRAALQPLGR